MLILYISSKIVQNASQYFVSAELTFSNLQVELFGREQGFMIVQKERREEGVLVVECGRHRLHLHNRVGIRSVDVELTSRHC